MKAAVVVAIAGLLCGANAAVGQSPATGPVPRPVSPPTPNVKTDTSEIWLTGLAQMGSAKLALIRVEKPGQSPNLLTLAEGESAGGIDLVKIDAAAARVTVRYDARLRELTLRDPRINQRPMPLSEKEKDISHSKHHTLRAKLDREQDEQQAREEKARAKAKSRQ
jgi:hypothetical protein